jgi:hypothetical protein
MVFCRRVHTLVKKLLNFFQNCTETFVACILFLITIFVHYYEARKHNTRHPHLFEMV